MVLKYFNKYQVSTVDFTANLNENRNYFVKNRSNRNESEVSLIESGHNCGTVFSSAFVGVHQNNVLPGQRFNRVFCVLRLHTMRTETIVHL